VLVFIDISGRRLHPFDPQSGRHEVDALAEDSECVAPSRGGGYVAGMRSGIWLLNASGEQRRKLADKGENATTNHFNDGRVDLRGRYVTGTVDEPKEWLPASL
jgi:sugar lactone lactonase YvrE